MSCPDSRPSDGTVVFTTVLLNIDGKVSIFCCPVGYESPCPGGYDANVKVKLCRFDTVMSSPGGYDTVMLSPGGYETVMFSPGGYDTVMSSPGGYETVMLIPSG